MSRLAGGAGTNTHMETLLIWGRCKKLGFGGSECRGCFGLGTLGCDRFRRGGSCGRATEFGDDTRKTE